MERHQKELVESLCKQFHHPIRIAAKNLNISVNKLRRVCRESGIVRWPFKTAQATMQRYQSFDFSISAQETRALVFIPQQIPKTFSPTTPVLHHDEVIEEEVTVLNLNHEQYHNSSMPSSLRLEPKVSSSHSSPARIGKASVMRKNLSPCNPSAPVEGLPSFKQLLIQTGLVDE